MTELEKELRQMEARYGQEFGDTSESEEEEGDTLETTNNGCGGQRSLCSTRIHLHTHTVWGRSYKYDTFTIDLDIEQIQFYI